jgi:hypothetical protein
VADRHVPDDADLPMTGIGLERERLLGPAFIQMPDARYGTRCSTVLVAERANKRLVTHVFERTFAPGGGVALVRRATLSDWPPRYADRPPTRVEDSYVTDSDVGEPLVAPDTLPARRSRARSLVKPLGKGG